MLSSRWISVWRGLLVLYLAETAAGALLEVCVHTAANGVPPNDTLLEVTVPTTTSVKTTKADLRQSDSYSGGDIYEEETSIKRT